MFLYPLFLLRLLSELFLKSYWASAAQTLKTPVLRSRFPICPTHSDRPVHLSAQCVSLSLLFTIQAFEVIIKTRTKQNKLKYEVSVSSSKAKTLVLWFVLY